MRERSTLKISFEEIFEDQGQKGIRENFSRKVIGREVLSRSRIREK